jgi:GT2 family glycosyltransferase
MSLSAIVPTLGRSPLLVPCLEALRRDGHDIEIIVVAQGEAAMDLSAGLADRVLRPGRNLGFAGGTNLGIAAASGRFVATVNDDVLIEPGWSTALVEALEADPRAAAAQGVNLLLDQPDLADGCGIAWNRWWQAVQIGHGLPAPPGTDGVREVFGVSATAAVFRREALEPDSQAGPLEPHPPGPPLPSPSRPPGEGGRASSVLLRGSGGGAPLPVDGGAMGEGSGVRPRGTPVPPVFDSRLLSYYEDVELAGRLRAAGWRALLVPAARARHAGSATGRTMSRERWRLIYGNRWLAAASLLGRSFWPRLPGLALRDLLDLGRAVLHRDGALLGGIPAGWGRAVRHLPAWARRGAPAVPVRTIRGFR